MQENSIKTPNKKLQRNQNRKRKLEAFFNIALMNDKQRVDNIEKQKRNEPDVKKKKRNVGRDLNHAKRKEIIANMEKSKQTSENKEKKPLVHGEEYRKLKLALNERKKLFKTQPRFWLHQNGSHASLELPVNERIPLFIGDVQHLVMYSVIGNRLHLENNRWFCLDRHGRVSHTTVLLLEGVGAGDLTKRLKNKKSDKVKNFSSLFSHQVELINPETYERSLADDFCLVPLSARLCRSMFLKYGNTEAELKSRVFRAAFPIGVAIEKTDDKKDDNKEDDSESDDNQAIKKSKDDKQGEKKEKTDKVKEEKKEKIEKKEVKPLCHPRDKFQRTELLLSPSQMIEEGYAIPIGQLAYKYQGYAYTKDHYAEVTPHSPMFGLDCEMCMTTARKNELTRVSIVDEDHNPVYETLVMPYNRITNYLTQYSGITRQMMIGVRTRIEDVQHDIRKLLPPDAILVGQSLNCDLHALQMYHPYVIDSSVVFNTRGQRKCKTKLKTMVEMFLGDKIQQGHDGHDSIEDAIAALKLVQLKLTKSIYFGDTVMGFKMEEVVSQSEAETDEIVEESEEEEDYKNTPVDMPQPEVLKIMEASSLFKLIGRTKKAGVFATPSTLEQYSKYLSGHHEMSGTVLSLRAGSHGFTADNNYKVSKMLMKEGSKFDLSLAHLKFDLSEEKERARAVNTCMKVAENLQDNGLMIVIAGGRPSKETDGRPSHRPACFVHLKVPQFTKL